MPGPVWAHVMAQLPVQYPAFLPLPLQRKVLFKVRSHHLQWRHLLQEQVVMVLPLGIALPFTPAVRLYRAMAVCIKLTTGLKAMHLKPAMVLMLTGH